MGTYSIDLIKVERSVEQNVKGRGWDGVDTEEDQGILSDHTLSYASTYSKSRPCQNRSIQGFSLCAEDGI